MFVWYKQSGDQRPARGRLLRRSEDGHWPGMEMQPLAPGVEDRDRDAASDSELSYCDVRGSCHGDAFPSFRDVVMAGEEQKRQKRSRTPADLCRGD